MRAEMAHYRITWREHRPTGLVAAYSDDLKGLLVIERSHEEALRALPYAVQELLECMGHKVQSVEIVKEDMPADWGPPSVALNADLADAG